MASLVHQVVTGGREHPFTSPPGMELSDFASESVIVRDERGVIKYWNAASEVLYGWPAMAMFTRCRSVVLEVARFQSESFDCCLRKPAPRFDLLIRSHHCTDNCFGLLRILFGHEVDRADGRTAPQWFSCHQYDLTICHISIYH